MRTCPFCNYDEGWVKETTFKRPIKDRVECHVCGATGPESFSYELAIKKWDGILIKIDNDKELKAMVKEDAMGGVSAPMATLNNTPGMGNAVPPSKGGTGSGDSWGNTINKKPYTQSTIKKKKKKRKIVKEEVIEEGNINPYDKIGMSMAKRMGVKPPFKKKKEKGNQNAISQQKFEHEIIPLDDFLKENK